MVGPIFQGWDKSIDHHARDQERAMNKELIVFQIGNRQSVRVRTGREDRDYENPSQATLQRISWLSHNEGIQTIVELGTDCIGIYFRLEE